MFEGVTFVIVAEFPLSNLRPKTCSIDFILQLKLGLVCIKEVQRASQGFSKETFLYSLTKNIQRGLDYKAKLAQVLFVHKRKQTRKSDIGN